MPDLQPSTPLCPNCQAAHDGLGTECTRCGVVFAKYKPLPFRITPQVGKDATAPPIATGLITGMWSQMRDLALTVEERVNPIVFGGRALVLVVLAVWGWTFMTASIASNYVGESFMHLINLPFHEAGHIFFTPFGRFMQVLGGSLGQLIIPMVCLGAFLFQQHNPFGASVALWWFAESLMDLAPYINDARALELMLIGGVTGKDVEDYHDWEYLLRTMGWLQYDHSLAGLAHGLGVVLMLASFAWAGWLLLRQFQRLG